MRKYFLYLMFYSVGGFILERIINVIALGEWYDNSVLIGPYQPLYGAGILMAIIIYDLFLNRFENKILKLTLLLIVSIITTGISEAVTGYSYEFLYGVGLWDYGQTFTCKLEYVCVLPTSIFGIFSFLVIVFIHPFVKGFINGIPKLFRKWLFRLVFLILIIDIFITFTFRLS